MVKRNVLLNPGPATTTDTVKQALIVPDICPREEEFVGVMQEVSKGLLKIVHADPSEYAAVLFCGSGTINMDICLNSLLPEGKKALVINNGAYSSRGAEICTYYGLDFIDLKLPIDKPADLGVIEETLKANPDVALVYTTHNETGTGLLNPIREIGALAHKYNAIFVVDTTSTYAMRPIDVNKDNIDFCMASAQKGIMAMTGLSFVIGKKSIIEASKDYPKRSYYCNLYMQYDYARAHGEMHFTPPVQVIYSARQALKEYFAEGEQAKWDRHYRVYKAIVSGLKELGFKVLIPDEIATGLVAAALYPDDSNWDFKKVHDYCYERGFTIYPGKVEKRGMFRLCSLGAIDETDIKDFFKVFGEALDKFEVSVPVKYEV
ncbi:2-aminoethylphosphonate-pyruvate transaminase [Lachnospiraceae bacterium G11]|nr:2-aminoethylphosphonate-pyruvate transaminase [Lachnospiraceae bacterium G11]